MMVNIKPSEIDSLAPMPASVPRLASLLFDDSVNLAEVVEIVRWDQALTANVLKAVNSITGGSRFQITSIKEAVSRLGTSQIFALSIGRVIAAPMQGACTGYDMGENDHWRHSVAAALAVEELHSMNPADISEFAFTGALLHDFGKLLLSRHMNYSTKVEIKDAVKREKITYYEGERRILGTDHAAVGAIIAEHWKFPEPLVLAIKHHHDPDFHPSPLMDTVHIGNTVAKLIGEGMGSEQMNLSVSAGATKRLNLNSAKLEKICSSVKVNLNNAVTAFGGNFDGT